MNRFLNLPGVSSLKLIKRTQKHLMNIAVEFLILPL